MFHSASMSQIPVISDVGFDYSCLDCDMLVTWTNLSLSTTLRNVAGSRSTLTKTGTSIGEHIHTWNLGGLDAILKNAIMQISVWFYCLVSSHLMMMLGLRWMLWNLYDDMSILVQVMAWCLEATNDHQIQSWYKSMSPCDVNKPQWVDILRPEQNGHHFQTAFSNAFSLCIYSLVPYTCTDHQRFMTHS